MVLAHVKRLLQQPVCPVASPAPAINVAGALRVAAEAGTGVFRASVATAKYVTGDAAATAKRAAQASRPRGAGITWRSSKGNDSALRQPQFLRTVNTWYKYIKMIE